MYRQLKIHGIFVSMSIDVKINGIIFHHLQRKHQKSKCNQAKGHREDLIHGENLRNMYFQSKDQFVFAEIYQLFSL